MLSAYTCSIDFHQLCLWKISFSCTTTTRRAHRIWNPDDGRRVIAAAFRVGEVVGVGLVGTDDGGGAGLVEFVVV